MICMILWILIAYDLMNIYDMDYLMNTNDMHDLMNINDVDDLMNINDLYYSSATGFEASPGAKSCRTHGYSY